MRQKMKWGKQKMTALAAVFLTVGCFGGNTAWAEEAQKESGIDGIRQNFLMEESAAVSVRLKMGEWLDYGNYGLERKDIPGTAFFSYITMRDAEENIINDQTLAYCVQSYFLTPLSGNYSEEMKDNISAIGGSNDLQKILYYGYGGAGYDRAEFEELLSQTDEEYYEQIYGQLSENRQQELAYILTHTAASYAYYMDGVSLEEYMKVQFQIKYGESWEKEYGYFLKSELAKAAITDEDLNLFGATYGMNEKGISFTKAWYQRLVDKKDPSLSITIADGLYTFDGNEKNEELELSFVVPEDFDCTLIHADGTEEEAAEGSEITVYPQESFRFTYQDEMSSTEKEKMLEQTAVVEGTLAGTESEAWNLVVIETNKGNSENVDKRQQDIAAVSMTNAGLKELDFVIELQMRYFSFTLTDENGEPVADAVFGVYYDPECEVPVHQEEANLMLTTDEDGVVYLEMADNGQLQENAGKLYAKEIEVPVGYVLDAQVICMEGRETAEGASVGDTANIINERQTISVGGTVSWNTSEGTEVPEEITIILRQDGEELDTKTVTGADDWKYQFEELPAYSKDGRTEYEYTIDVKSPEGYTIQIEEGEIICTHEVITETETESYTENEAVTEPGTVTDAVAETELITVTDAATEPETITENETVTEPGTVSDAVAKTELITVTDAATEPETITENETVTEPGTVSDAVAETELITVTDAATEPETITENETVTETETVTAAETDAEAAGQEEEAAAKEVKIPFTICLITVIIILILLYLKIVRRKK